MSLPPMKSKISYHLAHCDSQVCHITKSLHEEPLKRNYTMSAGDILLFKLK